MRRPPEDLRDAARRDRTDGPDAPRAGDRAGDEAPARPAGTTNHDVQRSEQRDTLVIEAAALVVCQRWKLALLWLLLSGPRRYMQLARRLAGVTPTMLTEQLRALERDGLVHRPTPAKRVARARHVEYALTPLGEAPRPVLLAFGEWARRYAEWARTRPQ
jgi:DNA-binding HxlR family transcriptional regulator